MAGTGEKARVQFEENAEAATSTANGSSGGAQPLFFGPDSALFGVHFPAPANPRALALLCPPFLHEHIRSYRFFSQVAESLAQAGIACLRFDYRGTGDSAGEDALFTFDTALADIETAASELRRRYGDAPPLALLSVRAACLLAQEGAQRSGASASWLWQPVRDGASYLDRLLARDEAERRSRMRYPLRNEPAPAGDHDLMGFTVAEDLHRQLRQARLPQPLMAHAIVLDDASIPWPAYERTPRILLPPTVTAWADEVDLTTVIPIRAAQPAIMELAATLVASGARHG